MSSKTQIWKRLGRIVAPDPDVPWLVSHAGAAFAVQVGETSEFDLFIAGRDSRNRSLIGKVRFDIGNPTAGCRVSAKPVLTCGELGAFDENGVSYPFLVRHGADTFMYYVGWTPTVLTPFQVHVGLAVETPDGSFRRVSRAPILERNNEDFLSLGSVGVLVESDLWRMWYTSFTQWGAGPSEHKHQYVIKYAESNDGVNWRRDNVVCIDRESDSEFSICRPTVHNIDGHYHMWYCTRGEHYRIGYATSPDGLEWRRQDDRLDLGVPNGPWDSLAQAYPNVFEYNGDLYMIYCGNDYGRDGLGLAVLVSGL